MDSSLSRSATFVLTAVGGIKAIKPSQRMDNHALRLDKQ
jgi:hypothetical protein